MAIINCLECNREISDSAAACPGCGAPLQKGAKQEHVTANTGQDMAFWLSKKQKTNHLLHLVLSVLTAGIWVIPWIFISLGTNSDNLAIDKKIAQVRLSNGTNTNAPPWLVALGNGDLPVGFVLVVLGIAIFVVYLLASRDGGYDSSYVAPVTVNSPDKIESLPSDCNASTELSGLEYRVLGDGILIRKGPGTNYDKIINVKATNITGKTHYITIDDSVTVREECKKGDWSWIRVIDPDWLEETHKGWVSNKFLKLRSLAPKERG